MIKDSFIYDSTSPELLFVNHTLRKILLSLVLCIFSYTVDWNLQRYVPMIVVDQEGHVSVQGCVDVTLATQEHTAWMVSLHTHAPAKAVDYHIYCISMWCFSRFTKTECKSLQPLEFLQKSFLRFKMLFV